MKKAAHSECLLQDRAQRKRVYCFCSVDIALGVSRNLWWPTSRGLGPALVNLKPWGGAGIMALQRGLGDAGRGSRLPVVAAVLFKGPWSLQRTSVCRASEPCHPEPALQGIPPGSPPLCKSPVCELGKSSLRFQKAADSSYMIGLKNRKVWLFRLGIFLLTRHSDWLLIPSNPKNVPLFTPCLIFSVFS